MLPEGWPGSNPGVEFCANTPVAAARGHSGLGPNSGPPPGSLVDPMPNQAPHHLALWGVWGLAALRYDVLQPG